MEDLETKIPHNSEQVASPQGSIEKFVHQNLPMVIVVGAISVVLAYILFVYIPQQQKILTNQVKQTQYFAQIASSTEATAQENTAKAQSAAEEAQSDAASAKENLAKAEIALKGTDVSSVVSEWENRVVQVTCSWGGSETLQGAATLVNLSGYGLTAITNAHVESDANGYAPSWCVMGIYGYGARTVTYDTNNPQFFSFANQGLDLSYIKLSTSSTESDNGSFDQFAASHLNVCDETTVTIGDKVLVLGYPWDGSASSVTATQGLISGFDGNYY